MPCCVCLKVRLIKKTNDQKANNSTEENPFEIIIPQSKGDYLSSTDFKKNVWIQVDRGQTYRIYSRISREILDKIQPKFYQFDLYPGHKKYLPKCTKTISCVFKSLLFTKIKLWTFRILDTFCHIFFKLQIRLN